MPENLVRKTTTFPQPIAKIIFISFTTNILSVNFFVREFSSFLSVFREKSKVTNP